MSYWGHIFSSGLNWTDLWAHSTDVYPSTDILILSLRTELKEHNYFDVTICGAHKATDYTLWCREAAIPF